jgi:lysozyme
MQASPKLYSFLKLAEGFLPRMKPDPPGSTRFAIGYGCQLCGAELDLWCNRQMTEAEADALLCQRVKRVVDAVNRLVKVPLEQHEFDALVSFAYNVGIGDKGFRGSTLLKKLNAGDKAAAPDQLKRWHWSGGVPHVLDGRRAAEVAIWNSEPVKGYGDEKNRAA